MYVGCWAGVTYRRYTVLTSSKKGETAVHCCDPALSVLAMLVSRNVVHVVSALQSIVFITECILWFTGRLAYNRGREAYINTVHQAANHMGPLQDTVTWHGINYTGTQVTQWDFQNKVTEVVPVQPDCPLKSHCVTCVPA